MRLANQKGSPSDSGSDNDSAKSTSSQGSQDVCQMVSGNSEKPGIIHREHPSSSAKKRKTK